jgi:hypothetical protein
MLAYGASRGRNGEISWKENGVISTHGNNATLRQQAAIVVRYVSQSKGGLTLAPRAAVASAVSMRRSANAKRGMAASK